MKKGFMAAAVFCILVSLIAFARADISLSVQQIIDQRIPCAQLNQTQREMVGDYYMSQVFSPQQHEYIDSMMGGDGAPMAEQMHINFAYRYYCDAGSAGTNATEPAYYGYGMMGSYGNADGYGNANGYGMMGYNYPAYFSSYPNKVNWYNIIFPALILVAIALLVIIAINQQKKNKNKK